MKINEILNEKRDEILKIAAIPGVQNVRVFGSIARGEAGFASDLDILVKLDADRTLLDLIPIKQDLEDLLGCQVDVVTEAGISPYIREQVLKEAVAL